jgi:predicted porin
MQFKLLAGLFGCCAAAPLLAQSNLTIYGVADAGIHVSSNGEGTKTKVVSGIADGSRLGFKGTEELGGGYKAIFNLEARVELDTGTQSAGNVSSNQGFALTRGMALPAPLLSAVRAALQPAAVVNTNNALFDRTAMVGLVTPVGAVLAGRMYTPGYEVLAAADTFEAGTAGNWGGVIMGTGGLLTTGVTIRSDKALQYRIELPNGVAGALMYGFKNSGYIGLDDKFWAANLRYKANGFDVGLGHNHGTDQNGNSGLISTTLGGSYATGNLKFFAGYHRMKNENSVLIPLVNAAFAPTFAGLGPAGSVLAANLNTNLVRNFKLDADSVSLGMHYTVGNGRIMGSVSHTNDKTAFNSDATQYALGYDHNLSKRTDLYTVVAYIRNQNDAQYAPGAASAPGGFTSAPGVAGKAIQFGIRHRF